jgi:hypothetical protein
VALALLGGYLLFCHGCHGDEDNELFISLGVYSMPRGDLWLTRGGELLATLRPDGRQFFTDHQAVEAAYETMPAFEPLRPLFEREAELLDVASEPENSEWLNIWEQLLAPGMFVETPDGRERIEILWVHFKAGRAWWFPLYTSTRTLLRQ